MNTQEQASPSQREISLYQCRSCAAPVYEDWIAQGEACRSCGGKYVIPARPTFYYVLRYLIHTGQLLRFVKENIFRAA